MQEEVMCDNSRAVVIAKYTDKSRYKKEYIYGDVYVDEERVKLSYKNKTENDKFKKELNTIIRFSEHFKCEVFLLPPNEKGKSIYKEKNSNPDAIVYKMFLEIKNPTGSIASIKTRFQESIHQADCVLISIINDTSIKKAKKWIENKLKTMDNHDGFVVVIEDYKNNYEFYKIEKGL